MIIEHKNWTYRKDCRDDVQSEKDINRGLVNERKIIEHFVHMTNDILDFDDFYYIDEWGDIGNQNGEDIIKNKTFYNKGDYWILSVYDTIPVEVKALMVQGNKFRFKKDNVEVCLRLKIPIIYAHREEAIRIFSLKELREVIKNPAVPLKQFGGKLGWIFDFYDYNDWIDYRTFKPYENHYQYLDILFKRR